MVPIRPNVHNSFPDYRTHFMPNGPENIPARPTRFAGLKWSPKFPSFSDPLRGLFSHKFDPQLYFPGPMDEIHLSPRDFGSKDYQAGVLC